jgi:chorismate mutase
MKDLNYYRKQIDKADKKIVKALINRYNVVNEIKIYKQENNIAVVDSGREASVIDRVKAQCYGPLTPEMVESIYKEIIANARKIQEKK